MRVFAALPLPQPVLLRLEEVGQLLKSRYRDLRVVRSEGMHVTLRFFGELDEEAVRRARGAMEDPALRIAPIAAALSHYGQFPPRGNPRVIWCGFGQGAQEISAFQKVFERLLAGAGFPPDPEERGFTPHVTLARNSRERVPPGALQALPPLPEPFLLDRLVLFQSILSRSGAEYHPLHTVRFGAGSGEGAP